MIKFNKKSALNNVIKKKTQLKKVMGLLQNNPGT
jgi:hypothetical protein